MPATLSPSPPAGEVRPTRDDPFVAAESSGAGGIIGRRASGAPVWWTPLRVCIVLALIAFGAGVLLRGGCADSGFQDGRQFIRMCYTDVGKLYVDRGLDQRTFPYAEREGTDAVEYPVLQGLLMWAPSLLVPQSGSVESRARTYYGLTALALFAFLIVALWATMRSAGRRPWDAAILAAAPSIALVGTLNWDLLPVALLALAILAWSRERPLLAGVLIGLGGAAKLYPLLLLLPLLLLAVRTGRYRGFLTAAGGAVVAWAVVNVPVALAYPEGWGRFFQLSRDRGFDFGSLWLGLRYLGVPVDGLQPSVTASALLAVLLIAVSVLTLLAPRRPRLVQVLLLVVVAFLISNKVYSPQFALWLLPLVALARPRWRDVLIWQGGQAVYYMGVWLWLNQFSDAERALSDRGYGLLVLVQFASQLYIVALVVRDILRPERDPVRADGVDDDPQGGEFDRAPDSALLQRLQPAAPPVVAAAAATSAATSVVDREESAVDDAVNDVDPEDDGREESGIDDAEPRSDSPLRTAVVDGDDAGRSAGLPGALGGLTFGDLSALRWWLLTRLGTLVAVSSAAWLLALGSDRPSAFFDRWVQWDAVHFETIARFGYDGDVTRPAVPFEAFFPGFPFALKPFLAVGMPAGLAGLLVSATALAVAVVALRRLGDLERGAGVGERAVILLLLSPWAVFLMAGYSEALFLGFAIPAWLAAKRQHWWFAGILAAGAATTRVTGLFLAAALVVLFALTARHKASTWPAVVIPFVPPALYTVFQWQRTGDWKRWLTAQEEGWDRRFTWPWKAWETTWNGAFGGGQPTNFEWMWRAELIAAVLTVVVIGWLIARRQWPELVYVGGQGAALLTSSYYFSMPRAFLLWWPLWIGLGAFVQRRPAWLPWLLAVFIPLNLALAIAFTRSQWAG